MVGIVPNEVRYVLVMPDGPLPDVRDAAPFKAVVVIEAPYAPEWQNAVSEWLVSNGCRYMMSWGPDCSSWDDSVDHADMARFPDSGIPDDQFVLTTWHDDEPLEQVFWFAQFCAQASYDDVELHRTLIVHISEHDREEWMKASFGRSFDSA